MTTARSANELGQINQLIHDRWFDISDVSFDARNRVVTIRFGRYGECCLRIHHVRQWSVEDRQRVGLYDFNEVVYEPAIQSVRITTGVPIGLLAEVDELEVSLEETDNSAIRS